MSDNTKEDNAELSEQELIDRALALRSEMTWLSPEVIWIIALAEKLQKRNTEIRELERDLVEAEQEYDKFEDLNIRQAKRVVALEAENAELRKRIDELELKDAI